ncbi:hypothetical protein M0Q50_09915 [bacterium]|jgi:hypothetical protein|nr:hypothetical protein [bacterium]
MSKINKYTTESEWDSMVGKRIKKISGKPFKSAMKMDFAIGIEINPLSNKKSFRMKECNTLVDCFLCKLV